MRSKKSLVNIIVSAGGNILNILITFVSRTIFIMILGTEYLGINGLFSNILVVLSLTELGIGAAITYSLYKPLAEYDIKKVNSLMHFFKIAYRIIGITITILGLILTPFIEFFIAEKPDIEGLHLIFFLFVVNSAVSYFFSYKRTIIIADQKQYIVSIYQYVFLVIQNLLQIVALYITENFIVYLLIQIFITILHNILMAKKADNLYPFLKNQRAEKLDSETLDTIKKNTGAMVFHKIGSMVVSSTDNILISKMVGIVTVGLYSNYVLIINAINGLLVQVFSAITASIGNIGATESKEYLYDTFKRVLFFNFWIYGFSTICLFTLINTFIELWIGTDMLLNITVVSLVVFNFYLSGMRRTVLMFRDALGLYWYDRYKPIAESIINLLASIYLAKMFGLVGIFLGTTISTITTSLWVEPWVLYKYGFKKNAYELLEYFRIIAKYTTILIIVLIINLKVSSFVSSLFIEHSFLYFISKTLVSITLPNLLFLILFYNSKEFKWLISLIFNLMNKRKNKLKGRIK